MSDNNISRAVNTFIRTNRMHKSLIDSSICSVFGLHRTQHIILMHLTGRSVFPSQKELAEHLGITPAAVTGALKKLEEDGYIERTSGSDNRYNEIKISDAGKAVVKETEKMFSEIDSRIFSGFTENEIAEFIELNLKIQNNIRLVTDGGESKK